MKAQLRKELINDLISQALKYAKMRIDWYGFSREERADKDSLRSSSDESAMATGVEEIEEANEDESLPFSFLKKRFLAHMS